jgi:hypothetical protein
MRVRTRHECSWRLRCGAHFQTKRTNMPKSATSLLGSTEVTQATIRRAVEAALTAVLQERKRRPVRPPPPLSEVERQVAKAAAGPTKPSRKRGFRGTPPPATFDLYALPDTALLTEYETAAAARLSTNTLATWRKRDDHPLKWLTIGGGRIRYCVAAVKEYLATGHRPRPGRPRAQDAAPPRRRAARPRAKADDLGAPQEPSS